MVSQADLDEWRSSAVTEAVLRSLHRAAAERKRQTCESFWQSGEQPMGYQLHRAFEEVVDFLETATADDIAAWLGGSEESEE